MIRSAILKLRLAVCRTFGHRWQYKDYSNHMKENGDDYDFSAARNCIRCMQYSYYYSTWTEQKKLKLDYESNYYSESSILINKVTYK